MPLTARSRHLTKSSSTNWSVVRKSATLRIAREFERTDVSRRRLKRDIAFRAQLAAVQGHRGRLGKIGLDRRQAEVREIDRQRPGKRLELQLAFRCKLACLVDSDIGVDLELRSRIGAPAVHGQRCGREFEARSGRHGAVLGEDFRVVDLNCAGGRREGRRVGRSLFRRCPGRCWSRSRCGVLRLTRGFARFAKQPLQTDRPVDLPRDVYMSVADADAADLQCLLAVRERQLLELELRHADARRAPATRSLSARSRTATLGIVTSSASGSSAN